MSKKIISQNSLNIAGNNIKQIRNIKPYERIKPARRKTFGRVDFAFKYKDSF